LKRYKCILCMQSVPYVNMGAGLQVHVITVVTGANHGMAHIRSSVAMHPGHASRVTDTMVAIPSSVAMHPGLPM
jgi:hypothetical protein